MKPHTYILLIAFTAISILFRVYPISPNFHPLLVFILFLGAQLPARTASISVILICLATDLAHACISNYPAFGSWSWFTYSGFLAVAILPHWLAIRPEKWNFVLAALGTNIAFWVWTNFGVWLASGLYQHTSSQLLDCYLAGLPFLRNSLLAALVFSGLLVIISRHSSFLKRHAV